MILENDSTEINNESSSEKAIQTLFKFNCSADFDTKTELTQNQIIDISKAVAFSEAFDLEIVKQFINSYKLHLISKNRKGRREVIEALTTPKEDTESSNDGFSNKLKNLISL